jgi:hypothetical protein
MQVQVSQTHAQQRGNTELHQNRNGKVRFSDDLRERLRVESQGIVDDWIRNPVDELGPEMMGRCTHLAEG